MKFESIDEILDYAIQREQDAADFYTELAEKMEKPAMKQVFLGFASEEMGHKKKLIAVKEGNKLDLPARAIMDLKIGDYLVDPEPTTNLGYQDALILAMKSEKLAYRLYTDLADAAEDPDMKQLFLALASEEAKHKLRFEVEYDEEVLREN